MGFFEKSQEKSVNLTKKKLDFVSLDFKKSLFSKAFKWKKCNFKPFKVRKRFQIFLVIYKIIYFPMPSHPLV